MLENTVGVLESKICTLLTQQLLLSDVKPKGQAFVCVVAACGWIRDGWCCCICLTNCLFWSLNSFFSLIGFALNSSLDKIKETHLQSHIATEFVAASKMSACCRTCAMTTSHSVFLLHCFSPQLVSLFCVSRLLSRCCATVFHTTGFVEWATVPTALPQSSPETREWKISTRICTYIPMKVQNKSLSQLVRGRSVCLQRGLLDSVMIATSGWSCAKAIRLLGPVTPGLKQASPSGCFIVFSCLQFVLCFIDYRRLQGQPGSVYLCVLECFATVVVLRIEGKSSFNLEILHIPYIFYVSRGL